MQSCAPFVVYLLIFSAVLDAVVLIGIRLNFHQLKLIASLVFSFFASRITSIVSEELLTTLGNATAASPNSSGLFSGL